MVSWRSKGSDSQVLRVDKTLDDLLAMEGWEETAKRQMTDPTSRAFKCRHLALNYFKTRRIKVIEQDVTSLALLLWKIASQAEKGE